MKRRALTLLLAGFVVIIFVSIGAALTFERGPLAGHAVVRATAAASTRSLDASTAWPEAGALILTGGALLGLAAVVRRSG